jgi:hypothetical protein
MVTRFGGWPSCQKSRHGRNNKWTYQAVFTTRERTGFTPVTCRQAMRTIPLDAQTFVSSRPPLELRRVTVGMDLAVKATNLAV